MRRVALAGILVLGGCTWSNSLYRARHLSDQALDFERNDRPFEAANLWGQVAVKADTAYARDPQGTRGAEALWLRGRALARTGGCARAVPALESALTASPQAKWREELELELGRCLDEAGDVRALQFFERLESSAVAPIRLAARTSAGRAHVMAGDWDKALAALGDIDTPGARMNRAIALAGLARVPDAAREIQPLLEVQDTTRRWEAVVTAFAAADPALADSVLARLLATRSVTAAELGKLNLAAARGAAARHPDYADLRLRELAGTTDRATATEGRLLIAERLVARAATPAMLRTALDSLRLLRTDEGQGTYRFNLLGRLAETLVVQHDSIAAGSRDGDLLTFLHGETARDSLAAPMLAQFFFIRLEREWPGSPYVAKALLARLVSEPDSADALRTRMMVDPESPYVAYLQGRETAKFAELEMALTAFAQSRRPRGGQPARPRPAAQGVPTGVDVP